MRRARLRREKCHCKGVKRLGILSLISEVTNARGENPQVGSQIFDCAGVQTAAEESIDILPKFSESLRRYIHSYPFYGIGARIRGTHAAMSCVCGCWNRVLDP